jgi:hypothetical protein
LGSSARICNYYKDEGNFTFSDDCGKPCLRQVILLASPFSSHSKVNIHLAARPLTTKTAKDHSRLQLICQSHVREDHGHGISRSPRGSAVISSPILTEVSPTAPTPFFTRSLGPNTTAASATSGSEVPVSFNDDVSPSTKNSEEHRDVTQASKWSNGSVESVTQSKEPPASSLTASLLDGLPEGNAPHMEREKHSPKLELSEKIFQLKEGIHWLTPDSRKWRYECDYSGEIPVIRLCHEKLAREFLYHLNRRCYGTIVW